MAKTLYEKVWDSHIVAAPEGEAPLIYVDRHLVHEVTSPQAFSGLKVAGRKLRAPEKTFATMDHNTSTKSASLDALSPMARTQVETLAQNCKEFGVRLYDIHHKNQGIVHVMGPELGITLPGTVIVCGDSHTSTHGALRSLAFGIGTSEVEHALATQCLNQKKAKNMLVSVDGQTGPGVTAKDIVLAIIGRIGTAGGTGYTIEFAGDAIRDLSMEGRMTICNMSIEGGARAGLIAPDDTTFQYIAGRTHAPQGAEWEQAVAYWRTLPSDDGATYDRSVTIEAAELEPMITYGTNQGMGMGIKNDIPLAEAVEGGVATYKK